MTKKVIVGVDIGGTNIRLGAVDASLNLLAPLVYVSRTVIHGPDAVENLLQCISDYLLSLEYDITAVSIGFPSILDRERKKLINTPNLEGLNNVEIAEHFRCRLRRPVYIERDAVMLLRYDIWQNGFSRDGIIIGIYVGTGLGNSIVINGKDLIGKDGAACELGHIPVIGKDDPCLCGLNGCLEMYAAGKRLERIWREHYSDVCLEDVFERYPDAPELAHFLENIADAAAIEINLFNPDIIVLGGGVLMMRGFPKKTLEEMIIQKTQKRFFRNAFRIVFSSPDSRFNGVIGAALYSMEQQNIKEKKYVGTCQ